MAILWDHRTEGDRPYVVGSRWHVGGESTYCLPLRTCHLSHLFSQIFQYYKAKLFIFIDIAALA
jgi:hypothetical protein